MTTMALTDYGEAIVFGHFFRSDYYSPGNLYLSLHSAGPGESFPYAAELAEGDGYDARPQVQFNTDGQSTNLIEIEATDDLGTVTHIGLCLDSEIGAGYMFAYAELSEPVTVNNGETFTVQIGDITLGLGDQATSTLLALVIEHFANNNTQSVSSAYLGLATDDPGVSGATNEHPAESSYERQAVGFTQTVDGDTGANAAPISFTASGGDFDPATHLVLWDAETDGAALMVYELPEPVTVLEGSPLVWPAGTMSWVSQ